MTDTSKSYPNTHTRNMNINEWLTGKKIINVSFSVRYAICSPIRMLIKISQKRYKQYSPSAKSMRSLFNRANNTRSSHTQKLFRYLRAYIIIPLLLKKTQIISRYTRTSLLSWTPLHHQRNAQPQPQKSHQSINHLPNTKTLWTPHPQSRRIHHQITTNR